MSIDSSSSTFSQREVLRDATPQRVERSRREAEVTAASVLLVHVYVADRWTVPDPAASRERLERAAAPHDHEARRVLAQGRDEWDE